MRGQVHRAEVPAGQRPCPRGQPAVQLLRRLDLDHPPPDPLHPPNLTTRSDTSSGERESVAGEGGHGAGDQAGVPVSRSSASASAHRAQPGVDAQPAQRLRLPGRGTGARPRAAGPGRCRGPAPGRRRVRPARLVVLDAVADVPAGPGQPGAAVEPDRGAPVAGHAERAAPGVRDRGGRATRREEVDQRPVQLAEDRGRRGRSRPGAASRSGTAPRGRRTPAGRRRCAGRR